jgi:endonuclease/exonuclease/phosphatase family metal-dependent hydrolase
MRLLADQLLALKPGIIACQECFFSNDGRVDTLRFLAEKLKMNYVFLPGRFKKRHYEGSLVDSYSGLGILSAFPITSFKHFDLPNVPDDNERKVLLAEIELSPEVRITIVNTHLTHLRYEVELRKNQAKVVADIANKNKKDNYSIICGDFNAKIGSTEINTLISKTKAIDCYAAGNGIKPRYSLVDSYIRNTPICVDHLFALPYQGKRIYPNLMNSGIVLNVPDKRTGLYPSDHFGISTTLVLDN